MIQFWKNWHLLTKFRPISVKMFKYNFKSWSNVYVKEMKSSTALNLQISPEAKTGYKNLIKCPICKCRIF